MGVTATLAVVAPGLVCDCPGALDGQAVEVVAEAMRAHGVTNLVVDPVLVATSGDSLAADGVAQALLTRCTMVRFPAGCMEAEMAVRMKMTQSACYGLHAPAVWCLTLALPCPIRLLLSAAVSMLSLRGAEILREEGGAWCPAV